MTGDAGQSMILQRAADEQDLALTGRWVGGDRKWVDGDVIRSTRIVVATDTHLYVHELFDSVRSGDLERVQLIERDEDELIDNTPGYEWTGHG